MNFALKYTANTFDDLYGLDNTVKSLLEIMGSKKFPKVMLFQGKTGSGKTTLMRIVAKSILCENPKDSGEGCNTCSTCMSINNGDDISSYVEYNASNINLEKSKEISGIASQYVFGGSKRVIAIDELQEFSKAPAALKHFLKTLEDKNTVTYFLLGSMGKVEKAIKDRAVTFFLSQENESDICNLLMSICMKEKIEITEKVEDAIIHIVSNCDGSVREAISYLERVVYSGDWSIESINSVLNIIDSDTIDDTINKLFSGDPSFLLNKFNQDFLDLLIGKMIILYKRVSGLKLPDYLSRKISGIKVQIDKNVLPKIIGELNKVYDNYYIKSSMIELAFINCLNIVSNRIENNVISNKTKRKRINE